MTSPGMAAVASVVSLLVAAAVAAPFARSTYRDLDAAEAKIRQFYEVDIPTLRRERDAARRSAAASQQLNAAMKRDLEALQKSCATDRSTLSTVKKGREQDKLAYEMSQRKPFDNLAVGTVPPTQKRLPRQRSEELRKRWAARSAKKRADKVKASAMIR